MVKKHKVVQPETDEIRIPQVEIQEVFLPLLTLKKRYKLYHGGRGGGKSYAFADALLILTQTKSMRIACIREVQKSIKESVYQLLKDRCELFGFSDFLFYEDRIENIRNGSTFIFKGMNDTNAMNIKSLEGIDIAWIEEAQSLSEKSWRILDPTIRKEESEIWISMNRDEEYDPVWKALAINPSDNTLIVKVNYYDNKFCPHVLKEQAEKMKDTDYLQYLHVWEGEPVQEGDKKLIALVDVKRALENQITQYSEVPLVVGVDVARFGDDKTAIARRRGRQAYAIKRFSKLDVVAVANLIKNIIHEEHPAIVNIDIGGLGAGVYDILIHDGFADIVRGVNFGESAQESERYCNRRAEMWCRVRDWLTAELPVSLTDCEGLVEDLTAPQKDYDKLGRVLIEKKDKIKERIGRSTDIADALALTFAEREYPLWLTTRQWQAQEYTDDNVYME